MKGLRSTFSLAQQPVKSLPSAPLLLPKCNYKPVEGGYFGLDRTQHRHKLLLGLKDRAILAKHLCTLPLHRPQVLQATED